MSKAQTTAPAADDADVDPTPTPKTTQAAPTRSPEEIQADIDAAKAAHAKLWPLVERERVKVNAQAERIERAKRRWRQEHDRDDPFDPEAFSPPLVPQQIDQQLHREFHALHYTISKLERELTRANKAPA